MIGSPQIPSFNAEAFDDSFFMNYDKQLAELSIEEQASAALADILTIEKRDGSQKSYQQLRDETRTFFANDWVRNDEAIMNRMAIEFAQACMSHNHGAELARDNQLGSVFGKGVDSLFGDKHDDSHDHKDKHDDEDEWEEGPDGKRRRKIRRGWFGSIVQSR